MLKVVYVMILNFNLPLRDNMIQFLCFFKVPGSSSGRE
jgi:hypothetical protein